MASPCKSGTERVVENIVLVCEEHGWWRIWVTTGGSCLGRETRKHASPPLDHTGLDQLKVLGEISHTPILPQPNGRMLRAIRLDPRSFPAQAGIPAPETACRPSRTGVWTSSAMPVDPSAMISWPNGSTCVDSRSTRLPANSKRIGSRLSPGSRDSRIYPDKFWHLV